MAVVGEAKTTNMEGLGALEWAPQSHRQRLLGSALQRHQCGRVEGMTGRCSPTMCFTRPSGGSGAR